MIILNKQNCPPISPAVGYNSLGASESIELYQLKFVESFIEGKLNFISDAKKQNWKIISTGIDFDVNDMKKDKKSKTVFLQDFEVDSKENIILVLGSEGNGVSSNIANLSNQYVYIPPHLDWKMAGKFPFTIIDSINVGVTAGIILNHLTNQMKCKLPSDQKNTINKNI